MINQQLRQAGWTADSTTLVYGQGVRPERHKHLAIAALGNPLVAYDQRVDVALQKILASRHWSTPQRQWLQRIAAQTKANVLVDREALDDPDLVLRREDGGFARLDRSFGGALHVGGRDR